MFNSELKINWKFTETQLEAVMAWLPSGYMCTKKLFKMKDYFSYLDTSIVTWYYWCSIIADVSFANNKGRELFFQWFYENCVRKMTKM